MIVLAATNTEELEKEWECLTELTKLGGGSLIEYSSRRLMTSLTDVCFTFHLTFSFAMACFELIKQTFATFHANTIV